MEHTVNIQIEYLLHIMIDLGQATDEECHNLTMKIQLQVYNAKRMYTHYK
jgi:hypothetical protein